MARGPLLTGHFTLATGAPDLAQSTGATLLPVIITCISGSQDFEAKIGKPRVTRLTCLSF